MAMKWRSTAGYGAKGSRMDGSVVAAINFYSTEETAIHMATLGSTEGEEIEAELACLSLFACRDLINLGPGLPADFLANLITTRLGDPEFLEAFTSHNSTEHWLVPFRGPSKQRFELSLNMEPFSFKLHIKGFGVRGKGLNWYGVTAVTSLSQHLCRTRGPQIFAPLAKTVAGVGYAYQSGTLRLHSQEQIALAAWAIGCAEREEVETTRPVSAKTSPARRRTEPLRAKGRR